MKFINIICLLVFILFGCQSNTNSNYSNSTLLPNASGENNEMLIIMDSTKFKGEIGRLLVGTYGSYIYGLPQPENNFDLIFIRPRNFNSILKYAKNIVVAFSLEGNSLDSKILRKEFNEKSIDKIKNDSSIFFFKRKDQYAKGQTILYLFSKTDNELINKIKKNKKMLLKYFQNEVSIRTSKEIFSKVEANISNKLFNDHRIKIKIPFGYDLAKNNNNFFWLRYLEPDYEKNIFVYYEDYVDNQFKHFGDFVQEKNIDKIRKKISLKYLKDSEKPEIYMSIQKMLPVETNIINFKGKYSLESKGLWKLSDISGGGPFHSFVIYDKEINRIYYIEGYVYAPGRKKRDLMQEIASILWTFEI